MSLMVPDRALCLGCNYALRGLSQPRCPECGRAFDPEDLSSMNLGRPLNRVARFLLRPTGLWAYAGQFVVTAWGLWLSTCMTSRAYLGVLFMLPLSLLVLACLVRGSIRGAAITLYRQPEALRRVDQRLYRRMRKWFWIVIVLIVTRLPAYAVWFASRPWMDSLGERVNDPVYAPLPPTQWAGLYRTAPADVRGGACRFHLYPGVTFGEVSFQRYGEDAYTRFTEPLGGGWYVEP
jgi:hypothetical protein